MRRSATVVLMSLMYTHSYAQAHPGPPGDGYGDCETANMGSTYIPIESWIYPAIERLALAGYIQTAFAGLRPWTRMESARLVEEAQAVAERSDFCDLAWYGKPLTHQGH